MNGFKIRRMREMMGKTQEELAKHLNLTHQAYSRMERGETGISTERLEKIAAALGIRIEDFYADDKKVVITNNTNHGEAKENSVQVHLTINENEKMLELLQQRIAAQADEINYLRKQLEKLTDLLISGKKS